MRTKNIAGNIRRKIEEWLESITDKEVRLLAKRDVVVTGGCIASMLLDEAVRDYDVYFSTKDTTFAVARYYVKKYKENHKTLSISVIFDADKDCVKVKIESAGVAGEVPEDNDNDKEPEDAKKSKKDPYRAVFLTANAITLSDKVQLVTRFYGTPEEIHDNYDFVHCMNYWTFEEGLVLKPEALEALLTKELRYLGSRYPLCSIFRTRKFIKRGYFINAGQYLKMAFQVAELDLTDLDVLEDQLTGVDTAYFMALVETVREEKEKNPGLKIDGLYITELVDKLF